MTAEIIHLVQKKEERQKKPLAVPEELETANDGAWKKAARRLEQSLHDKPKSYLVCSDGIIRVP